MVANGALRGWLDLESHDHAAYERGLESSVLTLARLVAQAHSAPPLDSTVAVLGAMLGDLRTRVETGPLVVDLLADTVELGGRRLRVGPVEWDILVYLARRLGQVVPYEDLVAWLWPSPRWRPGRPRSCSPSRQALRANVLRLRGHLDAAADLLVTVRETGVMLRAVAPSEVL